MTYCTSPNECLYQRQRASVSRPEKRKLKGKMTFRTTKKRQKETKRCAKLCSMSLQEYINAALDAANQKVMGEREAA